MPRKLRELRADLRQAGWRVVRQTGVTNFGNTPLVPGSEVNLAGRDGAAAHRYQERDVREAVRRASEAEGSQS